ncbi:type IV pilus assembly protein PilW [Variovorax sp. Sphag1AA]|nr:type IV pilus assembly protein PilW [Variovorax sp. Sphag1AA]
MIALAIGLVIVLAASSAFLGARKLFTNDTDVRSVQDTVRFTRHVAQRLIRQAGYSDYAPDHQPDGASVVASGVALSGNSKGPFDLSLAGASNTTVSKTLAEFGSTDSDRVHGSDSLMVRFFGRSNVDGSDADGTMHDCFGVAQTGPATFNDRAWNILYVDIATDGHPELYCKRRAGNGTVDVKELARGVELLKVVYGFDANDDSVPDTWLEAKEIEAKAATAGTDAYVQWLNVVAVRVGMVVRSNRPNAEWKQVGDAANYKLFPLGRDFPGIVFEPPDDGRFRAVSTFTVMLRNVQRDPA